MSESQNWITCREMVEILTDYLEGALPADQAELVERHLEACDACRRYLAQMRTTIEGVGRLAEADVPEELRAVLLAAFQGLSPP